MSESTLMALSPTELRTAQDDLKSWLDEKIQTLTSEHEGLELAVKEAKAAKWKSSHLTGAANRVLKRMSYYTRALEAVKAGYLLIPPFPIRAFAVRVNQDRPSNRIVSYKSSVSDASPTSAPSGTGEYVSNQVFISSDEVQENGKTVKQYWASGYADVEFPLQAIKPVLVERTKEAMALKVFDEIGLVGEARKDPILVGSVVFKEGWQTKRMNFFIAWWLDKERL